MPARFLLRYAASRATCATGRMDDPMGSGEKSGEEHGKKQDQGSQHGQHGLRQGEKGRQGQGGTGQGGAGGQQSGHSGGQGQKQPNR